MVYTPEQVEQLETDAWVDNSDSVQTPNKGKPEFIACSAVWYKDSKTRVHSPRNVESGLVVYGIGHHHCLSLLSEMFPGREYMNGNTEQGFMTSHCRFVDRTEAMAIAKEQNQLNGEYVFHELFSENLFY